MIVPPLRPLQSDGWHEDSRDGADKFSSIFIACPVVKSVHDLQSQRQRILTRFGVYNISQFGDVDLNLQGSLRR
jgi:hypothetical protein